MERFMESPIRVLVANRPRLMRELILTTFSDQPGIEIVGEIADEADIPASVEKTNPDVIVLA
jgi:chemotaxis response regulator CheB